MFIFSQHIRIVTMMSEKISRIWNGEDEVTAKVIFTVIRVTVGWVFMWAFLDKTFGWFSFEYKEATYGTTWENAWINGGDPTWGFLTFGTQGTLFESFFMSLAGNLFVTWIFMIGLLGIGLSVILNMGRKIGCISGAIMLFLMWLAALPINHNPIVDDHLVYMFVMIGLGFTKQFGYDFVPMWNNIVEKYKVGGFKILA